MQTSWKKQKNINLWAYIRPEVPSKCKNMKILDASADHTFSTRHDNDDKFLFCSTIFFSLIQQQEQAYFRFSCWIRRYSISQRT